MLFCLMRNFKQHLYRNVHHCGNPTDHASITIQSLSMGQLTKKSSVIFMNYLSPIQLALLNLEDLSYTRK